MVILAERGTLGAPVPGRVVPCHSECSCSHREKIIFLDSLGSDTQIGGRQNTVSIVGRRKRSTFNDIKEKMGKKLAG